MILFLRERYNYAIELIVGHSRGSIVGWAYYARFAEAMRTNAAEEHIPLWVSVAGRWRMAGIHKRDAEFNAGFEKEGVYRWKVRVAGKDREVIVRPEDVEAFAKFPLEETVRSFPTETDWCVRLASFSLMAQQLTPPAQPDSARHGGQDGADMRRRRLHQHADRAGAATGLVPAVCVSLRHTSASDRRLTSLSAQA